MTHDPPTGPGRRGLATLVTALLVVVGHALRNLTDGVGGPQDPAILNTPEGLEATAHAGGLTLERCEEVERDTEAGTAIDAVLVARRPE